MKQIDRKQLHKSFEAFDRRVSCQKLPNGMTCIFIPASKSDDRFYISTIVKAGSRVEQESQLGIAHFLEHMMFRGSSKFPTFGGLSEAFEWLGGEWNACTGHEYTEYMYSGVRRHARESIDLFAEFMSQPLFRDIEVERQIILRELNGELNEFGLSTDVVHHVSTLAWPTSSLARPIIGTAETLARIDEAALRAYRCRWYQPENMALCVVGGSDADAEYAAKIFSSYCPQFTENRSGVNIDTPLRSNSPKAMVVANSDNEYQFQASFHCQGQWDDQASVVEILVRLLADGFSARLPRRIREELGLVYDVGADATLLSDCGLLNVTAAIDAENIKSFVDELGAIIEQVATEVPSELEIERYRRRTIVDLEMAISDPASIAFRIGWDELYGETRLLATYAEAIQAVTPQMVRDVAAEIFQKKNRVAVILGPKEGTASHNPGEPGISEAKFNDMIDQTYL